MDRAELQEMMGSGGLFDFFNTFSGGSLKRFLSICLKYHALYYSFNYFHAFDCSCSLALERLAKEGEEGRKK
jgi:preprotein translocase subunit SecY